ncbi:DNAJ heat shock N-terminal domain-containing protein [Striga hermonthica]|uniref:DNAJ heat shock N-terminal domain-containing protein n=1 Tax=Striga hermonthica TaxID=68872 RepID=A0A9N7MKQ8_STRHE|nr:DNAJ heat shock N-terminal domain-containing protein [Striga hermonthica]
MECNRDEALRAKSLAEEKLDNKDFTGAKKFALKAKTLYPGLDGITQILTTLDVYLSAENKISGETDWYGLLNVSPSADDETIRKQYRKLALMLHPDKNKSVGAEGAFKLISEAWSLLSDKVKRLAYNQRRSSRGLQTTVQMQTGGPSAPPKANGFFNFGNKSTPVHRSQNNVSKPKPPPTQSSAQPNPRRDTFWTICLRCKMHYEYLKVYLNHTLLCPNCNEAFVASETAPPYNFTKPFSQAPPRQQHNAPPSNYSHAPPSRNNACDPAKNCPPPKNFPAAQKSGQPGMNSFVFTQPQQDLRPAQKSGPPGTNSIGFTQQQKDLCPGKANVGLTDPTIAAKAASVVQQAQERVKRGYNEMHRPMGWEGFQKKTKLDESSSSRHGTNNITAHGNNASSVPRGSGSAPGSNFYGFSGVNHWVNRNRELTATETRTLLIVKARKEVLNTLKWLEAETKPMDKGNETGKESKRQRHEETPNDNEYDENGGAEGPTAASMSVPDPDFHDFDQDRSEGSFGDNEVWAAYDDDDGMPRFYALVSKVVSRSPFKLRISWLNSKTTSEFGSFDWVGSGFYKTCGEFRVGRYEICKSINSFSQRVNWSKGPRGSILILPRKGDVWALYKNWSSDWDENTPDEVIHKYDMVTVLDDYNEENGVSVAPLVKVAGFKTVFRPDSCPETIRRIPREEMLRFSHRVPYHLLTGLEGANAPKGCLELDPAATPLELLQVVTGESRAHLGKETKDF